jgi:hypothetical protein
MHTAGAQAPRTEVFFDDARINQSSLLPTSARGATPFTDPGRSWDFQVWSGSARPGSIDRKSNEEGRCSTSSLHTSTRSSFAAPKASAPRSRVSGARARVEYVGLILLVSLLMVGMVAAMKGFNRLRR